jgi:hypothetical protein
VTTQTCALALFERSHSLAVHTFCEVRSALCELSQHDALSIKPYNIGIKRIIVHSSSNNALGTPVRVRQQGRNEITT